jgi:hypothetical protein
LKARIVKTAVARERSVNTPDARQWLTSCHVMAMTDAYATIEELSEVVFSVRSNVDHLPLPMMADGPRYVARAVTAQITPLSAGFTNETCVEAGSNTSTVTLRVIGGDEKGSLRSETVKYGRESRTRERLHWQVPAAYTNDRLVLSSERAPHKNKTVTVKL